MKQALLLGSALAAGACSDATNPAVSRAEQAVMAELRDPDSAKFTDVGQCGKSPIVSGKVNARNKYGGYDGPLTFYYADGEATAFSLEKDGPFTDTFVLLHERDTGSIIARCTAAVTGEAPPITPEGNDMDMNATSAMTPASPSADQDALTANQALEDARRAVINAQDALETATGTYDTGNNAGE